MFWKYATSLQKNTHTTTWVLCKFTAYFQHTFTTSFEGCFRQAAYFGNIWPILVCELNVVVFYIIQKFKILSLIVNNSLIANNNTRGVVTLEIKSIDVKSFIRYFNFQITFLTLLFAILRKFVWSFVSLEFCLFLEHRFSKSTYGGLLLWFCNTVIPGNNP